MSEQCSPDTGIDAQERIAELQYEAGMYQSLYENLKASLAQSPNDAISAVIAEAYGMIGLQLTIPQARRLANAALEAAQTQPDQYRIETALREFFRPLDAVQWSSDDVERVYYSGFPLRALAKALAASFSASNPVTSTDRCRYCDEIVGPGHDCSSVSSNNSGGK